MITLATDRYSSFQRLAHAVVSALVSVERSGELRPEAVTGVESQAVQDVSSGLSTEDWDLLFRAVLARMVSTVAEGVTQAADDGADTRSSRARTAILECVQALDQLRTSATRM